MASPNPNARASATTGMVHSINMLWTIPMVAEALAFGFGLAMVFGTLQVYFRDVASFLPYFIRIWLYLSPVIYYVESLPKNMKAFEVFNPLFPLSGGYGEALGGHAPTASMLFGGAAWAIGACVPVSYTHLRAHETVLELVCRLLLEK